MRAVIVDTNVFVSGIFFSGPPHTILDAWRQGKLTLVVSPAILDEYRRVAHELAGQFLGVDPGPPLELLAIHARLVNAPDLPQQVCSDADDDMFLACAVASGAKVIASGDKALLKTSGYSGIEVLTPRAFVTRFLQ
jgi:putative PIN family toxin of toxin-antitoxin system